jgi:hypothetical protein
MQQLSEWAVFFVNEWRMVKKCLAMLGINKNVVSLQKNK